MRHCAPFVPNKWAVVVPKSQMPHSTFPRCCFSAAASPLLIPNSICAMDWFDRQPFLARDMVSLNEFEYDCDATLPLAVIQKCYMHSGERIEDDRFELRGDDGWERLRVSNACPSRVRYLGLWLELIRSRTHPCSGTTPMMTLQDCLRESVSCKYILTPISLLKRVYLISSFHLSFVPRAEEVFDGIPSELLDFCMARDQWEEITSKFCVQNLLVKSIRQKVASMTVDTVKLHSGDPYGETGDLLRALTIYLSAPSHDGLAISSVHFTHARLTLGVILGASPVQVDRIQALLNKAYQAISHPLLMLGLAAELQLDLLTESIETLRDSSVRLSRGITESVAANYMLQSEAIRSQAMRLAEEAKRSTQTLQKVLPSYSIYATDNHFEGGDSEQELTPDIWVRNKIRARFEEIFTETNSIIALAQLTVDEVVSTSNTVNAFFNSLLFPVVMT